jgi:hypothetical protein
LRCPVRKLCGRNGGSSSSVSNHLMTRQFVRSFISHKDQPNIRSTSS